MKTKIRSITIMTHQETKSYCIGHIYNDLALHEIRDYSVEFPDAYRSMYMGLTANEERIFEIIDVPVEVAFCAGEERADE